MKVAGIVGPTAVGKTRAAVEVAEELDGEIVSVDSMKIYVGMDVGTAKPSREEMDRVPHHLIDVRDPSQEVSVAEFQALGRAAVEDISMRGKLPLLVGGSGLYFRAVVDPLDFPPRSPVVRSALESVVEDEGTEGLYERLRAADPVAAERIDPGNARRIVRALEVIELTGDPFSSNTSWEGYESIYELSAVGLEVERDDLYRRIADRVDGMLADGLAAEAEKVAARGMSRTARQALGYRQILEPSGPPNVREEMVRATKRFARRQESWFRADPRITWFDAGAADLGDLISEHFRHHLRLP